MITLVLFVTFVLFSGHYYCVFSASLALPAIALVRTASCPDSGQYLIFPSVVI